MKNYEYSINFTTFPTLECLWYGFWTWFSDFCKKRLTLEKISFFGHYRGCFGQWAGHSKGHSYLDSWFLIRAIISVIRIWKGHFYGSSSHLKRSLLPLDRSFLPLDRSFFSLEVPFFPLQGSFLLLEGSSLPLEGSALPLERSFVPLERSFLPWEVSF